MRSTAAKNVSTRLVMKKISPITMQHTAMQLQVLIILIKHPFHHQSSNIDILSNANYNSHIISTSISNSHIIMKFNTIAIAALSIIASATQVNARRRHLNTIKGDESDASMSYMLSPARGSSSKSKSAPTPVGKTRLPTSAPTAFPTGSPTPEVCCDIYYVCCI